jgi:hypothetical protein
MMTMSKDIKEVTRVNLIKNISPRRPTRGTTKPALQFTNPALQSPSCPLDAASTLRDGAHSMFGYAEKGRVRPAIERASKRSSPAVQEQPGRPGAAMELAGQYCR